MSQERRTAGKNPQFPASRADAETAKTVKDTLTILHADHAALVNRNPAEVENATAVFEKTSKRWGLNLNRRKTAWVPRDDPATYEDEKSEEQKKYEKQAVYLGSVASETPGVFPW